MKCTSLRSSKVLFVPPSAKPRFNSSQSKKFDTIPETKPIDTRDLDNIAKFIDSSKKLVVISGAGIR